ncbi:MAG: flavin reductase [Myxococcota bacterium]
MSTPSEKTSQPLDDTFESMPVGPSFFQNSAYFPMPVVLVGTRGPDGASNLAPYSLCFPAPGLAPDAMTLRCRAESNTAQNLLRSGMASLNFVSDAAHHIANMRVLGTPGASAGKMAQSVFRLMPSERPGVEGGEAPPEVVAEAVQVFECRLDRDSAPTVDGENLWLPLRVERVLLKSRWRQALETGGAPPHLPIDYGFRTPTASWLSRASTRYDAPRLRPRFEVTVPLTADAIVERFRRALGSPGCPLVGAATMKHVQLAFPKAERTTWSPTLDLMLSDGDDGAVLHGRIGPHPHIWTMFLGIHALVGFAGLGGLMYGFAQLTIGSEPWALWSLPIALVLHAFVAGAAFIGQGLGAEQVHRVRAFVEDTLAS